jgi:hypothetical protein
MIMSSNNMLTFPLVFGQKVHFWFTCVRNFDLIVHYRSNPSNRRPIGLDGV